MLQAQGRLVDMRVLALDMAALLAGTQYRGSFEERLHGVINEVQQSQRGIILFIDEIHTVIGAGQVRFPVVRGTWVKHFSHRIKVSKLIGSYSEEQ
jgi:hypothetical protein